MTRSPACPGTQGASLVLWSTSRTSPVGVATVRCSWVPTCSGSALSVPSKVTSAPARPEAMSWWRVASSGVAWSLLPPLQAASRAALASAQSGRQVDPAFIDRFAHYDSGGTALGHGPDVVEAGDAAGVVDRVAGCADGPAKGGQVGSGEGAVPLHDGQDDGRQRQLLPGAEEGLELDPLALRPARDLRRAAAEVEGADHPARVAAGDAGEAIRVPHGRSAHDHRRRARVQPARRGGLVAHPTRDLDLEARLGDDPGDQLAVGRGPADGG